MRRFAASVNVVSPADGGQKSGMTATAVCSVTAEPPSALIIVNRSNRSHATIARTRKFAVNVLANDQRHLAAQFAAKLPDPFHDVPHRAGTTGCPLIEGADAHMECVVVQEVDVGTHTIFVGKVDATSRSNREPLLSRGSIPRPCRGGAPRVTIMSEPSSRNAEMTVAAHNGSESAEQRPAVPQTADSLLDLLQERALNLRQLFWRAHRA